MVRSMRAAPQTIIRSTAQHPAVRTIVDRLTLLRIGAHATTSSRGPSSGAGGRCRTCSNIHAHPPASSSARHARPGRRRRTGRAAGRTASPPRLRSTASAAARRAAPGRSTGTAATRAPARRSPASGSRGEPAAEPGQELLVALLDLVEVPRLRAPSRAGRRSPACAPTNTCASPSTPASSSTRSTSATPVRRAGSPRRPAPGCRDRPRSAGCAAGAGSAARSPARGPARAASARPTPRPRR